MRRKGRRIGVRSIETPPRRSDLRAGSLLVASHELGTRLLGKTATSDTIQETKANLPRYGQSLD